MRSQVVLFAIYLVVVLTGLAWFAAAALARR
jgi:uncharacterized protein YjeT (DUF2065 family)